MRSERSRVHGTGERPAVRRILLGLALLVGPMFAYPGDWALQGPLGSSDQTAWATVGALVFLCVAAGAVLVLLALRQLLAAWRDRPEGTTRRALAKALGARRGRRVLYLSAFLYVLLVGTFLSLYGWSPSGPGVWAGAYPSATNVLCCGTVGETPVAILLVTPTLEFVAYPIVLVTVFAATVLFASNVAVATTLLARRRAAPAVGGASLGTVSALFVNCPSCGTILLGNLLAGTAGAGILVAWATYSIPLMLVSFPLAVLALVFGGRALARDRAAPSCPPFPAAT